MGSIWQAQSGESLAMLIGPSWAPNSLPDRPIGHQIWGPLGKEDVCPNFSLTVPNFVFNNSGNIRVPVKSNPPKSMSCPKCPFGQCMGQNSSADWAFYSPTLYKIKSPIAKL